MLNAGSQPLVKVHGGDKLAVVVQEILQGKIYFEASGPNPIPYTVPKTGETKKVPAHRAFVE